MADGPGYTVDFQRRRSGRTDYMQRFQLLKSGKPRAVIRLTNNQVIVQVVTYHADGDHTEAAYQSQQLRVHGWEAHTGNIPAAYLTGYAAGLHAQANGYQEAVADLGLHNVHAGGRLFAAVAGLQDAGITVPADTDVLPGEHRLTGGHIDDGVPSMVETVKEQLDKEVS